VLRGPQGTLFGASSMGGALRYIPREASLRNYSVYARGELNTVQHGGQGGEAGVAVGGPIIEDVLGFRASAFFRRDPGFIDLISVPSATVVDRTGSRGPIEGAGGSIVATAPTSVYDKDANRSDVWAFQGSLNFQPSENVRAKPSVLYQTRDVNYAGDSIDLPFSDSSSGKFNAMWFSGAAPTAQNGYLQLVRPDGKGGKDKLAVVTLPIEVDVGPVTLYSTTGYVYNKRDYTLDFTLGNMTVYGSLPWVPAGGRVSNWNIDTQKSFTQEFRASIGSKEDRFSGTVGLFYNFQRQFENEYAEWNNFTQLQSFFFIPPATTPFGPQYANWQNIWGTPMIGPNGAGYFDYVIKSKERQSSAFAQFDFKLTPRLTLTAGLRYSVNQLKYSLDADGPINNTNAPFGAPCPTGQTCVFNAPGPFAPSFAQANEEVTENIFTPKIGLSFQADERNLFYASASKGFRPGAAQAPLPTGCNGDLAAFGFFDSNGRPATPPTIESDSLWSYEAGAKNRLLGGALVLDTSVYLIKWKNIQTSLLLPQCGYGINTNFGAAEVKGIDLGATWQATPNLLLMGSLAYTDATLTEGLDSPSGVILAEGTAVPGSGPPLNVTVGARIELPFAEQYRPYLRVDAVAFSKARRTGRAVREAFNFDPLLQPNDAYTIVNMRAGFELENVEASLFVNNLLNEDKLLDVQHSYPAFQWQGRPIRPRVMGVTVTYRY
jgi:iron complex outermembrane receptor protein